MRERKDPGDALNYCLNQVQQFDYERYVTTLFAPADKRVFLWVLYAFNLELSQISEKVKEPLIGLIRLQWWRDAIIQLYRGNVLQHEVLKSLSLCLEHMKWQEKDFQDLILSYEEEYHDREMTIEKKWQVAEIKADVLLKLVGEAVGVETMADDRKLVGGCFEMLQEAVKMNDTQEKQALLVNIQSKNDGFSSKKTKALNPFLIYFITKRKIKTLQNKKNVQPMEKDFLLPAVVFIHKIFAV